MGPKVRINWLRDGCAEIGRKLWDRGEGGRKGLDQTVHLLMYSCRAKMPFGEVPGWNRAGKTASRLDGKWKRSRLSGLCVFCKAMSVKLVWLGGKYNLQ